MEKLLLEVSCTVLEVREFVHTHTSTSLIVSGQISGLIYDVAIYTD